MFPPYKSKWSDINSQWESVQWVGRVTSAFVPQGGTTAEQAVRAAIVVRTSGGQPPSRRSGASGQQHNLLITDNNMPRLTGVELVKKLRSARMALPVITATGRLLTEELAQNPSLQLAAVLPKPFSIAELLETVRVVLRATDSARGQIASLPNWQSQPSADGLQL